MKGETTEYRLPVGFWTALFAGVFMVGVELVATLTPLTTIPAGQQLTVGDGLAIAMGLVASAVVIGWTVRFLRRRRKSLLLREELLLLPNIARDIHGLVAHGLLRRPVWTDGTERLVAPEAIAEHAGVRSA